jgi:hypothetical protein
MSRDLPRLLSVVCALGGLILTLGWRQLQVEPAASADEPSTLTTGIIGEVVLWSACRGPVDVNRPCPDRAYQATITVLDEYRQLVLQFQTDSDGRFAVALPPGSYTLHPESPGSLPRAQDQEITVTDGNLVTVRIQYDSGMR